MAAKRVIVWILAMLTLAQCTLADEVVLRSGKTYRGIVADRDRLAAMPHRFQTLSVFTDTTGAGATSVVRIQRSLADYVVLEDAGQKRIFDMRVSAIGPGVSPRPPLNPYSIQSPPGFQRWAGVTLALFGLGVGVLGATVKMGDAEITTTSDGLRVEDHTYNAANYSLMIGGGLAAMTGIVLLSLENSGNADELAALRGRGPGVRLGVAARF